jgi:hypothetical protein
MGVAFLNPWFWLGALAHRPRPLWHPLKRKRRRKKLIQFTTVLRFHDEETASEAKLARGGFRHIFLFTGCCGTTGIFLLVHTPPFAWPCTYRTWGGAERFPIKAQYRLHSGTNTLVSPPPPRRTMASKRDRRNASPTKSQKPPLTSISGRRIDIQILMLVDRLRRQSQIPRNSRSKPKKKTPYSNGAPILAAFPPAGSLLANSFGEHKQINLSRC